MIVFANQLKDALPCNKTNILKYLLTYSVSVHAKEEQTIYVL